jgi:hypothetical protein
MKRNKLQKIKEEKKRFLVNSHRKNKERFDKRKQENIIVNFSFLTKMG